MLNTALCWRKRETCEQCMGGKVKLYCLKQKMLKMQKQWMGRGSKHILKNNNTVSLSLSLSLSLNKEKKKKGNKSTRQHVI